MFALSGDWTRALVLVGWGATVIGLIDNLLYPLLVGQEMRLHTLPVFRDRRRRRGHRRVRDGARSRPPGDDGQAAGRLKSAEPGRATDRDSADLSVRLSTTHLAELAQCPSAISAAG